LKANNFGFSSFTFGFSGEARFSFSRSKSISETIAGQTLDKWEAQSYYQEWIPTLRLGTRKQLLRKRKLGKSVIFVSPSDLKQRLIAKQNRNKNFGVQSFSFRRVVSGLPS
jgi:hypothetical protein